MEDFSPLILMRSPGPFFFILLFISQLYVGLIAFYPSLRSQNSRKKREPVPRSKGVLYIFAGTLGIIYNLYVFYILFGGTHRLLPISDKALFRSIDIGIIAYIFIFVLINYLFFNKKEQSHQNSEE